MSVFNISLILARSEYSSPGKVNLCVHYPDAYPDVLPELSIKHEDESINDADIEKLLSELREVVRRTLSISYPGHSLCQHMYHQGEENLGMAMTFTLVSHLREQLSQLVRSKLEEERKREAEKERLELEVCFDLLQFIVLILVVL